MEPHLAAIAVLLSLSTVCAGMSEETHHGRVLLQDTTADGRALLQFKQEALEGDSLNGTLSTWGSNTSSYCNWAGVMCNTDIPRRVIALNITNIALNGNLSSALANLSFLENLTLSGTNLRGIIPPAFGKLSNLRILELFNNSLTGPVPVELADCKNLTSLFLEQNKLSGVLPPELGSLRQLEILNFKENRINGTLPDSLGNCVNLRELNGRTNLLVGEIPKSLGNCSRLFYFDFEDNELTGTLPESFGQLQELSSVYLRFNKLTGGIGMLGNCSKITSSISLTTCSMEPFRHIQVNDGISWRTTKRRTMISRGKSLLRSPPTVLVSKMWSSATTSSSMEQYHQISANARYWKACNSGTPVCLEEFPKSSEDCQGFDFST